MGENMVELDGGIIMKKEKRRDRLYDVLSIFLGLASLIFGFLIYANNDVNGVYISKVLHTDVSFVEMNKKINSFFDSFLKFNDDKETKTVLGEITYFELENNKFSSSEQFVQALDDCTISYVTQESDMTFSIVVCYDSFDAIYSNLENVEVKPGDRIKGGDSLGGYQEYFKALFKKGDQIVQYKDIF